MSRRTVEWTLPGDVLDRARSLWRRGVPLATEAAGVDFTPVRFPVKGPSSAQRGARFDDLRRWLDAWRSTPAVMRVEWKPVNDRVLGRLDLPVAAYLDTVDAIAKALGVDALRDLSVFRENFAITPEQFQIYPARRPLRMVEIGGDWSAVISAAQWLTDNPNSGLHARQIPAEGVHTKIVEKYRRDIAEMVPPPRETAEVSGKGWFAARYGLASKPTRVRLRFLDPLIDAGPWSDVEVPVEEAAAHPVAVDRILVVENEVSFVTLPPMSGTVAVFGDGRRAGSLVHRIPWLVSAPIWYWGDVDTWGLVILDGLRAVVEDRVPVTSLLMDEATLLGHREAWVREEAPTGQIVPHLTEDESALYDGLVSGRWGAQVRLEQERIRWPAVVDAFDRAGFSAAIP